MARRGFPGYSDLSPEQQAAVDATAELHEVFAGALRRGSPTHPAHPFSCVCGCRESLDKGAPVAVVKAIKGHGKKQGEPSRVELDYGKRLESLRMAGELRSVEHQPPPVEIAHRCTYRADFRVVELDGDVVYVEVKGANRPGKNGKTTPRYYDDGARVKLKVAARVLASKKPPARVVVVWPAADGRAWMRETVKA